MPANLENSAVATGLEKVISFQSQRMSENDQTIALLHPSHTQVMFKILQAKLQQYMNCELRGVQDRFRKGRGTEDQIGNIHCIIKKVRKFQKKKKIYFCFIDYPKAFDCVDI